MKKTLKFSSVVLPTLPPYHSNVYTSMYIKIVNYKTHQSTKIMNVKCLQLMFNLYKMSDNLSYKITFLLIFVNLKNVINHYLYKSQLYF